ncbi:Hypothetical_protein [Hexamita inflata]|uniref:Hypothetical_protein n=1 Tax=Hexamita inflata TaxID=28002 RepID=A0AA86P363_9EUKA|nr:Hypothetical protein HINF_LOCUS17002 [Hexamita inflata]
MISMHFVYSCYTTAQLSVSQSRSELLFTSPITTLSEPTLTSCLNNILNNISIVFLNDLLLPVAQFTKFSSINKVLQLTESEIVSPSFKQAQFNSRNVSFISVQYLDVYFTVNANVTVVGQIINPNVDSNQTVVYSVSTAFALMVLIIVIVVILYFMTKHKQNQLQNKKITQDKMSFETVKGGEMIFSTCKIDNNLSLPGTPRRHTLNRVNSQSKLKTKVNKQKVQKFDKIPPSKLKIQYRAQPKSIDEIEQDKQELENIMSKNAKVAHQLKQYTVHRVDSESIIPLCEVINLSEEQKDEVIQMTSQKELQDFLFAFLSNDQFQSEVDVEEPQTSIIINEENDKEPEIVQINDPKLNAIYEKIGLTKMCLTITNEDIITL